MKKSLPLIIAVLLAVGLLHFSGIGCPIRFLTGISCAGCGMTRAWLCVLQGKFAEAFRFHPLVLFTVPCAVFFLLYKKLPERMRKAGTALIVILFLTVYLFRLFNPQDGVVVFSPEEGFVFRVLRGLTGV